MGRVDPPLLPKVKSEFQDPFKISYPPKKYPFQNQIDLEDKLDTTHPRPHPPAQPNIYQAPVKLN